MGEARVTNPSVAVVIPFGGSHPEWLREAVASACAQAIDEIEIVVVADGPVADLDGISADPRVRVVERPRAGRSAARNAGIAASTAPLVAFLDADDLFEPEKLVRQVDVLAGRPDAMWCHTSYMRVDSAGRPLEVRHTGQFRGRVEDEIAANCPIALSTVVVRRDALPAEPFPDGIEVGEDLLLWIRLAQASELLGLDEPLARIRMHGANSALDVEATVRVRRRAMSLLSRRARIRVRASIHATRAVQAGEAESPAVVRLLWHSLLAFALHPSDRDPLRYARAVLRRQVGR